MTLSAQSHSPGCPGAEEFLKTILVGLIQGFLLFYPAETIKKRLDCIERSAMQFLGVSQQAETYAKLAVQRLGVIANHVQTAALRRPFRPEGADNYMPPRA